jgi:hypothetical protein
LRTLATTFLRKKTKNIIIANLKKTQTQQKVLDQAPVEVSLADSTDTQINNKEIR